MGETEISWTHRPGTVGRSWNPGQGCSRVSEGCRHCYAERLAARFAESGWSQGLINLKTKKWNGTVRLVPHKLAEPLSWRKPSTVFANSMTDIFHEGYTNEQIAAMFGVMAACPQHTFQVLTKRAKRMREWFEWIAARDPGWEALRCQEISGTAGAPVALMHPNEYCWPLPNVWLGVSVENQEAADERIPELLRTPAAVRFLSCEPLLGPVILQGDEPPPAMHWRGYLGNRCHVRPTVDHSPRTCSNEAHYRPGVDWVIAGCESGRGARPCSVEWLRSLRDQCAEAGVAFFLKQAVESIDRDRHGIREARPDLRFGSGSSRKPGGVIELPYLDGVQHAAFPEVR